MDAKPTALGDMATLGSFLRARCGSLKAAFHALDTKSDGHLTYEEFAQGIRRLGYDKDAEMVFRAIDSQNCGRISLRSFLLCERGALGDSLSTSTRSGTPSECTLSPRSRPVSSEQSATSSTRPTSSPGTAAEAIVGQSDNGIDVVELCQRVAKVEEWLAAEQALRLDAEQRFGQRVRDPPGANVAEQVGALKQQVAEERLRRQADNTALRSSLEVLQLQQSGLHLGTDLTDLRGQLDCYKEKTDKSLVAMQAIGQGMTELSGASEEQFGRLAKLEDAREQVLVQLDTLRKLSDGLQGRLDELSGQVDIMGSARGEDDQRARVLRQFTDGVQGRLDELSKRLDNEDGRQAHALRQLTDGMQERFDTLSERFDSEHADLWVAVREEGKHAHALRQLTSRFEEMSKRVDAEQAELWTSLREDGHRSLSLRQRADGMHVRIDELSKRIEAEQAKLWTFVQETNPRAQLFVEHAGGLQETEQANSFATVHRDDHRADAQAAMELACSMHGRFDELLKRLDTEHPEQQASIRNAQQGMQSCIDEMSKRLNAEQAELWASMREHHQLLEQVTDGIQGRLDELSQRFDVESANPMADVRQDQGVGTPKFAREDTAAAACAKTGSAVRGQESSMTESVPLARESLAVAELDERVRCAEQALELHLSSVQGDLAQQAAALQELWGLVSVRDTARLQVRQGVASASNLAGSVMASFAQELGAQHGDDQGPSKGDVIVAEDTGLDERIHAIVLEEVKAHSRIFEEASTLFIQECKESLQGADAGFASVRKEVRQQAMELEDVRHALDSECEERVAKHLELADSLEEKIQAVQKSEVSREEKQTSMEQSFGCMNVAIKAQGSMIEEIRRKLLESEKAQLSSVARHRIDGPKTALLSDGSPRSQCQRRADVAEGTEPSIVSCVSEGDDRDDLENSLFSVASPARLHAQQVPGRNQSGPSISKSCSPQSYTYAPAEEPLNNSEMTNLSSSQGHHHARSPSATPASLASSRSRPWSARHALAKPLGQKPRPEEEKRSDHKPEVLNAMQSLREEVLRSPRYPDDTASAQEKQQDMKPAVLSAMQSLRNEVCRLHGSENEHSNILASRPSPTLEAKASSSAQSAPSKRAPVMSTPVEVWRPGCGTYKPTEEGQRRCSIIGSAPLCTEVPEPIRQWRPSGGQPVGSAPVPTPVLRQDSTGTSSGEVHGRLSKRIASVMGHRQATAPVRQRSVG